MATTPEAADDRMPDGLRSLLAYLASVGNAPLWPPKHDHLEGLGLARRYPGCAVLTDTGAALWSLLNAADMIQSAERDIAAAGYTYSVERDHQDGEWQVQLYRDAGHYRLPCAPASTLAQAMWEARSDAIAHKL